MVTKIDYSVLAWPKDGQKATSRQKASVKALVFAREGERCRAWGISPVCLGRAWDRHELIPIGIGGAVTTRNAVAICRPCHRATQNGIGGHRLRFTWPGKAQGQAPNADKPAAVRAVWRSVWMGVAPVTKGI